MRYRFLFSWLCVPIVVTAQTFTEVTPNNIPALESGDMAWADYNNDGYLDFAIIGNSDAGFFGAVYTGTGTGSFQMLATNDMPQLRLGDIDWGDFDNDGDLDLAMIGALDAAPWSAMVIMRNNVTSFERYFTTTGSQGGTLTWLDYDNDRDLDIYQAGNFWSNNFPNTVFVNSGGQFSTENAFQIKGYYSELEVDFPWCVATDFDQDGDQDIFSSGKYSHGVWSEASLLVNKGVKDIENTDLYRFSYRDVATRNGSINQGDFNADGRVDYFITGNSSSINAQDTPFSQVLLGTGDGNFLRNGGLLSVYNSSSDVGDIDNDGDLDILVAGWSFGGPVTKIFLNNGSANFSDAGVTELTGVSQCSVALADYDNDGDLDVLMIGRDQADQKATRLYRNNLLSKTPAPNQKPAAPANLRVNMVDNHVILEWDRASDKETPAASLTYNAYVAIASEMPFKCFPQANVTTGKRKVFEQGNASINTQLSVNNLLTGTYYFSVQSIDGANEGSEFADEVSFHFTRIQAEGFTCPGSEQTFFASVAPSSYDWTVSGGTIISGQGSERIRVRWDKQLTSPSVTASSNVSSGSIKPIVQSLPAAEIKGLTKICDMTNMGTYEPAIYSQNLSYHWNIDGTEYNTASPYFDWKSAGNKQVILKTTDLTTQCTNSDTLNVIVSKYISVKVENQDGVYSPIDINPSYTYSWQQYKGNMWIDVSQEQSYTPTAIGNYKLTIINQFGCTYSGSFYVNEIVTGMEDQPRQIQLLPNPATTSFRIVNLPKIKRPVFVSLVDMAGRSQLVVAKDDEWMEIDCSSLSAAMYVVCIEIDGKVIRSKIMIH